MKTDIEHAKKLDQRIWDLLRHQRMELHEASLISNEEYAALAFDHPAVARLETYDQMRAELAAARERIAALERENAALRNVAGDNLCRFDMDAAKAEAKVLPEPEFLESCRRFRQQVAAERGEALGCMTIAQLEQRIAELEKIECIPPTYCKNCGHVSLKGARAADTASVQSPALQQDSRDGAQGVQDSSGISRETD